MAGIFLLLVLINIPLQRIFAAKLDCSFVEYSTLMNCDQCIKCGGHWCISPDSGVLCTLSFLATGSYQRIVGVGQHLTQRTTSRCVREVVQALNHNWMVSRWIVFPQTPHERTQIKEKFHRRHNLPGVIGCIDCTHIAIVRPDEDEHLFFNRKGYHSLNVQVESHCSILPFGEHGCSSYREEDIFMYIAPRKNYNNESIVQPTDLEQTIKVTETKTVHFKTPSKGTIDFNSDIATVKPSSRPNCNGGQCTRKYDITVELGFCSDTDGPLQTFVVPLTINGTTYSKAKFNVPCACQCSQNVSVNDAFCNGHGNLTCGVCTCQEDWMGDRCQQGVPYDEREYVEVDNGYGGIRGDVGDCTHPMKPEVSCSGNGKCDEHCICNKLDGWQYYSGIYCEDLCMTTSAIFEADENPPSIHFAPYNKTVTMDRDSKNRKIWVECIVEVNEYEWYYFTRKNVKNQIAVMMVRSKQAAVVGAAGGVNVAALVVPLVVVVALAMAGTAYYIWHKGGAATTSSGMYQGLDGPKTRVETNPTYIEPIKSYSNPKYGQEV